MATVVPFRGIRYHRDLAPDLARLITPPYDVIGPADQERYYQAHPHNVIRLELGRTLPGDDAMENRYTRAAAFFRRWLDQGVLKAEDRPALYLYRQEFAVDGAVKIRTGIVGAVRIEPYEKKVVLPHEETLSGAKADRLELMRACSASFSPVFGLYADPAGTLDELLARVAARGSAATCTDEDGQRHTLWVVAEEKEIAAIQAALADKQVFIADGHHRYETAQAYEREREGAPDAPWHYVMMTLVNLYDPGLVILPTHRLVRNVPGLDFPALLASLARDFLIAEYRLADEGRLEHFLTMLQAVGAEGRHAFGLSGDGTTVHLLVLKKDVDPDRVLPANRSPAWRQLDVAILQGLVLEKLLGIDDAACRRGDQLAYTRDAGEALAALAAGTHQLAFLLNGTPVTAVTAVAQSGEKMPQKSTFFYPKLVTGLVMYGLD